MRKSLMVLMFYSCIATVSYAQPSFIKDSIDHYILEGMKDWNIPGLAVAIVKDGHIVKMQGYGVRDVKTNAPVDENTLFMIASNSKLFTATSIAQLDYDKRLSLDDKVGKYIKGYTLFDKNTTDLVTIRDLLSHRLGTKTFQGDFTFWNGNLSRRQIIEKMKYLKPAGQFRQDFGYCNSCFLTAGEIIPVVTGKPWEVYVYDSILTPLGMSNTYTLGAGVSQMPNVAKPYTNQFTGELYELPYDKVDNLGPAGSMLSSVKDMAKWLTMQLDSGRYEGKRILPWPVIRRTRDMNTIISSRKSGNYPVHFSGYGLGIFMNDYNGRQLYYHTGGAFGFVTNTCFVPEAGLGIVILTNNDNQDFFELLRYQILDAYLDVPYRNRSKQELAGAKKEQETIVNDITTLKNRVKGTNTPLNLDAYAGDYANELYGTISIQKDKSGKKLVVNFRGHNNLTASLEYMDNDEWLLTYSPLAWGVFATRFKTQNNKIISVEVKANDFVEYDPYTFTKK